MMLLLQVGRGLVGVAGCVRGTTLRGNTLILTLKHTPIQSCSLGVLSAGIRIPAQSLLSPADGHEEQQQQQQQVTEFQDVPHLLEMATSSGSLVNAHQGLHKLSEWVYNKKVDFHKDVNPKEEFAKLMSVIDQGTIRSSPSSLLAALRSLTRMGVSTDTHVIQSIEHQLMWNIRKVSFPVLVSILVFHIKYQNTELSKKVLREAVEAVQRRWVEVTKASEVEVFYLHHNLFTSEFLCRLDDRTTELAAEMSYEELVKVFCALGSVQRRATPVLRSLVFHMARQGGGGGGGGGGEQQQQQQVTPKMLSNLLYGAQSLTFPDPVLLEKVAADLTPQVPAIDKPALVGNVLFCMGQLRWRCPVLLEALAEWIHKNVKACPPQTLAAALLTLATVSYVPTNSDALLSEMLPRLTQGSLPRASAWLDVVWALVVMGHANTQQVASVLNPTFVAAVTAAEPQHRPGVRLKLLNVDAAAGLLMPEYSGPRLDTAELIGASVPVRGREELRLSRHVLGTLHNLVPPPRYLLENLPAPMGVHVDGELVVDKQGRPLPIQDHGSVLTTGKGPPPPPPSPLPEGGVRMGLLVWGFRDYTMGTQELVGSAKLALRLLEARGCQALQVPYFEYSTKAKTLKNVQYLEAKMKEVISNTTNNNNSNISSDNTAS